MSRLAALAATTAAAGLLAGAWYYAAMWPDSQLFGPTLIAGHDPGEIALTFDDGPNDAATPQMLDLLARHGVRATFFVVGSYVRREPALARRVHAEGHLIGNHTMHHPRLAFAPAARVRQELVDANAAIEDVTGAAVRYFRPPFGSRRPVVLRLARGLGLTPVMWNVSGRDWTAIGPQGIVANLERGIAGNIRRGRGSNLLLHDGSHRGMSAGRMDTVEAVAHLLAAHPAERFVTPVAWTPLP